MRRIALYLRVSTDEQSVDLQRRDLLAYCQRHSDWHITEYVDSGVSGAKASRPSLDRLMNDVRHNKVDCVCVWKLDRLSRSLRQLIETAEEFKARGIDFISYSEAIDTSTPQGLLFFHMVGAFAQFERSLIRERVMAGQAAAKAKGRHLGRPCGVSAEVVQQIRSLRAANVPWRSVAAQAGIPLATAYRLAR